MVIFYITIEWRAKLQLGGFAPPRRLRSRLGLAQAIVATAHPIARVIFAMVKGNSLINHFLTGNMKIAFASAKCKSLKSKRIH
jgi:hypothetical protein